MDTRSSSDRFRRPSHRASQRRLGRRHGVSAAAALLLAVPLTTAIGLPATTAHAEPVPDGQYEVHNLAELQAALGGCASAPLTITLAADIVSAGNELTIGCDTTLDVAAYDLSVRNIIIGTGHTFEVTGPVDGTEGTLSVNATGVSGVAGIRTTGATLHVTGARLDVRSGLHGAAIGGSGGNGGGTVLVDDGTVTAAVTGAYGAAIGGGYPSGDGGVLTVTGGNVSASSSTPYATVIGGGSNLIAQPSGDGATVTVTGGTLSAVTTGNTAVAFGSGTGDTDFNAGPQVPNGRSGTITIGSGGTVIASSPYSAIGSGRIGGQPMVPGAFDLVQVDGTLILPSGQLRVADNPALAAEIVVGPSGRILGADGNPTAGATITGEFETYTTGKIANSGVIALSPIPSMVTGNNVLLQFDTGGGTDPADVRVFGPSPDAAFRELPVPPAGTAWNTQSDGTGDWFDGASDTTNSGSVATIQLFAAAPGAFEISTLPEELTAVAGEPFAFPVTVNDPSGDPLVPQPTISYTATDCGFDGADVFTLAGACTVTASTTVSGALLETEFDIEVLAAAAAVLELVPSATSVEQGGSLTFTVTGEDAYGNSAETSAAVLSSSVATDVIDGRTVTFPHASPHTITATLGEVTASVLIEVKVKPGGGGLVSTGADDGTAAMMGAGALALVIAGAALLLARRRSSRAEV